jgi:branched-chain amino acid transport system ATP-binding protein
MPLLEVRNVTKRFGGLTAIDRVSLSVEPGAVTAVIGPNGAGKTTLFNLITGVNRPTEGAIVFKGQDITGRAPHMISRHGIARTFQNIRLFPSLTVADNLAVAMTGKHRPNPVTVLGLPLTRRRHLEHLHAVSLGLLARLDIARLASSYPPELSYGDQRRTEIARALATEPELLLLDEPAAGMNLTEAETLAAFIREVRAQLRVSVLLIDHNVPFVSGLSDHIAVLNFGQKIAEGTAAEVRAHPEVVAAYLGVEQPPGDRAIVPADHGDGR